MPKRKHQIVQKPKGFMGDGIKDPEDNDILSGRGDAINRYVHIPRKG